MSEAILDRALRVQSGVGPVHRLQEKVLEIELRFYYASRLIGALVLATAVPLLIDRRARRSSRVRQ